jgi:hypothetical protein
MIRIETGARLRRGVLEYDGQAAERRLAGQNIFR